MARRAAPASALAIEMSSRAAKLMEADLAPLRIARVRASTVAEPSPDGLGALKALLDAAPVTGREVGLAIGREAFTLRTLELPSRDPKEIASMLELQLGKLTPYPRAEIFFAWSLIGTFRDGYTTVLLAVGRKALIDGALALLAAKGARALWIGISTEGLAAWSAADAKTAPAAATRAAVVIDVDMASTDCAVIADGRLLFSHSIAIGHEQLAASDQTRLRWVAELVRLPRILAHEEIKSTIGRASVTGVTTHVGPLVEQLSSQWGVPVELVNALGAVPASVTAAVAATPVSYTALAGLLATGQAPKMDLLPAESRLSQTLQTRSKHLARLTGSIAIILVFALVLYLEQLIILRGYLGQLQDQLALVERTSQETLTRQHAMRQAREWIIQGRQASEAVAAAAAAADAGITITQLSFEDGKPLTFRGRADTMPGAFTFLDRLKQQPVCANVHARSVAKAKGPRADGAEFEIVCELQGV